MMNSFATLDEVLLISLFIAAIVGLFLLLLVVWALISFVNSHRRIAEALELLNEKLKSFSESEKPDKQADKDWKFGDPQKTSSQDPLAKTRQQKSR